MGGVFRIILLFTALFARASMGKLETTAAATATVTNGTAQITVIDNAEVVSGITVRIENSDLEEIRKSALTIA